eukprot:gene8283-6438_t
MWGTPSEVTATQRAAELLELELTTTAAVLASQAAVATAVAIVAASSTAQTAPGEAEEVDWPNDYYSEYDAGQLDVGDAADAGMDAG